MMTVTSGFPGAWLVAMASLALPLLPAHAITPAEQLSAYTAQAGAPAQATRGQQSFLTAGTARIGLAPLAMGPAPPRRANTPALER